MAICFYLHGGLLLGLCIAFALGVAMLVSNDQPPDHIENFRENPTAAEIFYDSFARDIGRLLPLPNSLEPVRRHIGAGLGVAAIGLAVAVWGGYGAAWNRAVCGFVRGHAPDASGGSVSLNSSSLNGRQTAKVARSS